MSKQLTKAQKRLIEAMRAGWKLWVFGDYGFELQAALGETCTYPQWRTVKILLEKGLLRWKPCKNDTQRECGICELELI